MPAYTKKLPFGPRAQLAIALICGLLLWVGWNMYRIAQRGALFELISVNGGTIWYTTDDGRETTSRLPVLYRAFGCRAVGRIWLPEETFPPQIRDRIQRVSRGRRRRGRAAVWIAT